MDDDLGAFIRSRRARLRPDDVGLPPGGRRRVPGLRREELAALASVSVDTVVRLEQGRVGASPVVLDALAGALRLDAAERAHLHALAGRAGPSGGVADDAAPRPELVRVVRALDPLPAYVVAADLEPLAWNAVAGRLLALDDRAGAERNIARRVFLDPSFAALLGPPERAGADVVAALRAAAGAGHGRAASLARELAGRSPAFRTLWDRRDVVEKRSGRKLFTHPDVGRLDLDWERLVVPGPEGMSVMVYSAEPGSPSATGLALLSALAATTAAGAG